MEIPTNEMIRTLMQYQDKIQAQALECDSLRRKNLALSAALSEAQGQVKEMLYQMKQMQLQLDFLTYASAQNENKSDSHSLQPESLEHVGNPSVAIDRRRFKFHLRKDKVDVDERIQTRSRTSRLASFMKSLTPQRRSAPSSRRLSMTSSVETDNKGASLYMSKLSDSPKRRRIMVNTSDVLQSLVINMDGLSVETNGLALAENKPVAETSVTQRSDSSSVSSETKQPQAGFTISLDEARTHSSICTKNGKNKSGRTSMSKLSRNKSPNSVMEMVQPPSQIMFNAGTRVEL